MIALRSFLVRFCWWLTVISESIAALLLAFIVVVNALGVFYRYVLVDPIGWTEESMRYAVIWATFLAGAAALYRGEHMVLNLFENVAALWLREPLSAAKLGGASVAAERVHVGDGRRDVRPHALDQRAVAGVSVVLGDQPDELPVAVVLGDRVRPLVARAAGDLAVLVLERREPLDEVAHDVRMPHPEQRRRRERAVADPGTIVVARARLDRAAVAIDADPMDLRRDGLGNVGERGCRGEVMERGWNRNTEDRLSARQRKARQ